MLKPLRKFNAERLLWRVYWHGRSESAFNRLAAFYLPWVKSLAYAYSQRLPDNVDWQDVMQDGLIALLDCIQRFDKARGTTFKTFATRRVTGAFCDGLRNVDWVPRLVRHRGETPVIMRQGKIIVTEAGREINELDGDFHDRNRLEMSDEVRHALRGLNTHQRLILTLYYIAGQTMREIGESLGISESRVSQVMTATKAFLRAREGIPAEKSA